MNFSNLTFLLFLVSLSLNDVYSLPDGCNCRLPASSVKSQNIVPFQVSVQVNGNHICAGIVLDENTVLSSASCLNDLKVEEITVVAGIKTLDEKSESNTYKVNAINLPDSFNVDIGANNTAILFLSNKLNLEDNKIEKACLRMYDQKFKKAIFNGWGPDRRFTLDINGTISPKPVPKNELKNLEFGIIDEIKSKTIWYLLLLKSDLKASGVCLFDEGGALYVTEDNNTYVIGIADESLLGPNRSDVNLADICLNKSAFIKLSSIDFFIKKHATPNMCLIYEN